MKHWYSPTPLENEDDRQSARILAAVLWASLAAFFIAGLAGLYWHDTVTIASAVVGCVLFGMTLWVLRRGYLRAGGLVFTMGMLVLVTVVCTLGQGIHDPTVMIYPIIVLFLGLTLPGRAFQFGVLLTVAALAWLVFGEAGGVFAPAPSDAPDWALFAIQAGVLLVGAFTVSLLAANLRSSLAQARRELAQRTLSEEALRQVAERFESVTHSAMDAFWAADLDGRILETNEATLTMYGYSREEMLALHLADLDVDESPELVREHQQRILERGEDRFEARHRRKDGTVIDVEVSAKAWGAQGVIGSFTRDLTERKRVENELRDTNELFSELLRHTPVYTYIKTVTPTESRVVRASDNFHLMIGSAAHDMVGKTMDQLFPPELAASMAADDWAVVMSGEVLEFDETFNGRFYTTIKFPIVQGERTLLGGYTIDVTERQRTEEALRASEEQLRQGQRMEAVGLLAGGIAHDFNNLLTAIIGQTELLMGNSDSSAERDEGLAEIRSAADRAAALTRQLLAFSRRQTLRPHVLDVGVVAESMIGLLSRLLGDDIELVFVRDAGLWPAEADPGQLEQVLMNLAVNARDAMPGGGRLTIATANVELDADFAGTHPGVEAGPHVLLTVSDTGHGMSEETLSRIFDPFFTTKELGKGTGLGLSTVYGIVKQSGGSIWVSSDPGEGTTFSTYLPRAEKPLDWSPVEPSGAVAADRGGCETVLVVEDEPAVLSLTARVLTGRGYHVLAAESPQAALDLLDLHPTSVDLILTDMMLPGMSGSALVERVLNRPGIAPKVVYMSGYTQDADFHNGGLARAAAFVEKPFTPEGLLIKVREVLDVSGEGER